MGERRNGAGADGEQPCFGGFFGVLVFQAVLLGVLGPAGLREPGASVAGGPQTLAFFVGSIGGYAGLLSLDYLLARFFPGGSEEHGAAADSRRGIRRPQPWVT